MRVGFVGLGRMGGPMAGHVVAAGHDVAGFDTSDDRVAAIAAVGARAATSPADAAAGCDVVSVVVLDDAQVLDVAIGTDGVLPAMAAGSVLALHSTVTLDCIRRVDAAAREHDVRVIDAGISGGVPGAEAGTLVVIAGGEDVTLAAALPAMEPWSREVVHVGPLGAGMAAKVARNYAQYATFAVVHEAQALAAAAGVDLATFTHLIDATDVRGLLDTVLGRRDVTPRPARDLGPLTEPLLGVIALGAKDLDVADALAREVDVPLPCLAGVRAGFARSLGVDPDA